MMDGAETRITRVQGPFFFKAFVSHAIRLVPSRIFSHPIRHVPALPGEYPLSILSVSVPNSDPIRPICSICSGICPARLPEWLLLVLPTASLCPHSTQIISPNIGFVESRRFFFFFFFFTTNRNPAFCPHARCAACHSTRSSSQEGTELERHLYQRVYVFFQK